MGLLNAKTFSFDGQDCSKYGLIICWFGGADSDTDTGLEVELNRGEMNVVRTEPNQYGATYTDTLTFEIGVIKNPCIASQSQNFTFEESRTLNNWLRGSNVYKPLHFDDALPEQINFYAVCTNIIDIVYNGHNGKKLTFVCNSPFGFTVPFNKKIVVKDNETKTEFIHNLSDNGDYYPTLSVETDGSYSDTVEIENETDSKKAVIDFTDIDVIDGKKMVILDCKMSKILNKNNQLIPAYKLGWDDVSNIYWLKLLPGKNKLVIKGTCIIQMTLQFPRKVGIL